MFHLIKHKFKFLNLCSTKSLKNNIKTQVKTFYNQNKNEKEKFWEEYSKIKKKGEKYPSLKSQEIKIYQTDNQWIFAERYCIKNTEFLQILQNIELGFNPPFVIIDVREESEFMIYKLPEKNQVI